MYKVIEVCIDILRILFSFKIYVFSSSIFKNILTIQLDFLNNVKPLSSIISGSNKVLSQIQNDKILIQGKQLGHFAALISKTDLDSTNLKK